MNKEFFKSLLLTALIVLTAVMTKNLLDSKTPDMTIQSTVDVAIEKNILNIEHVIYPQGFVIGFGGGSYTGVYSEETRESIWTITTELFTTYLSQLDSVVIEEEEFQSIEKTRSVQLELPFPIHLNDLGEIFGVEKGVDEILDTPVNEIVFSSSQQNRIYLSNEATGSYFYIKTATNDGRMANLINRVSESTFSEYRRIDSLINFKALKDDEAEVFMNDEIIPITALKDIPFIKVTKEVDSDDESQESDIKTFLIRAFGNSTDFIKHLEEIDGSQTYIYGYGDKALRLGIDGKISYQEKLQASTDTMQVSFKEGLDIALKFVENYGNTPQSIYMSAYKNYTDGVYDVKVYYFDYRIKDLNVYTKSMSDGHAIEVVLKNDVVTSFTKNIRRYVKSIDTSEIWSNGPIYVESLINENFDVISKNFNDDMNLSFSDTEANWQMTTYVLSIMENLNNIDLYYYLDSDLDDERLIPAWRVDIGNTRYYFHVYTGDILSVYKMQEPETVEISRR